MDINLILFTAFALISTAAFFWKRSLRKLIMISFILVLGLFMGDSISPIEIIRNVFMV
jgi:hypothetical protein